MTQSIEGSISYYTHPDLLKEYYDIGTFLQPYFPGFGPKALGDP